jgi:hypothetical protein
MCVIRFDGEKVACVALAIHGRNLPGAEDYWDGNFLWCTADVATGAFRGSVSNVIRNEDLIRFLRRLEDLDQRPGGEALLDTLDGWLDLRLVGVGDGSVELRGQICDAPVGGNQLEFRLALDQTRLPPLIEQVRAAVEAFPVVGRRSV